MKVPVSWLKAYVDSEATPEQLAERLTFSGMEVGGIEKIGAHYEGVVVGEILAIDRHPSADRLTICRVHDGQKECRVVCGATNFTVGDKAPFAGVGASLPSGITIRKAKIRGEASEGMLCAEDELAISKDHSGLMLLPRDVRTGTPLNEILGPPDAVIDLEITWNRSDCLCIIGVAREVAALFGSKLKLPSVDFLEAGEPVDALTQVTIDDAVGCPRYTARVLTGATLKPSPFWMQRRLSLCGCRPINNVVDITNYVMLECGQPLHSFDYTLLANHEIIVRRARAGEKMATLDGIDRPITPAELLIADGHRPVAIAGVMGGAGSEIRDETHDVLLESACFDPATIHKTSVRLGLSTEASARFERSVDIGGVDWASRRAAALMVDLAGAVAAQGVVDVYPGQPAARTVTCRYQRTRDLIGVELADDKIASILESLELPMERRNRESCTVRVPTFRPDITLEADLIEEVARIHGLDQVPEAMPQAKVVPDADDAPTRAVMACRANLVGLGLCETMNYSFLSQDLLDTFGVDDAARRVVLPNPVSSDYAVMRNSLVPQMVDSLGRNLSRQVLDAAFFEIGKVFMKDDKGAIKEEDRLCIGLMGKVGRGQLDARRPVDPDEMFLWIKGIVQAICASQHLEGMEFARIEKSGMESGWAVSISLGGRPCGVMGLLAEPIRRKWRLAEPVAVAEMSLRPVLARMSRVPQAKVVPAYPSITRDVAMFVNRDVTHEDVLKVIWKSAPPELTEVKLFDIFVTKVVGEARKSLAYSLIYRSLERTLTDEDANRYHEEIKKSLKSRLGAEIRES